MSDYKMYLGDSVYAEFEDGMVKLTTNNGYPDDPRNVIYLETAVWCSLMVWHERAIDNMKWKHEKAHDEKMKRLADAAKQDSTD